MPFNWIWIFAPIGLLGIYLLVRGLRGKRVDGEPRCRKCGYNLSGLTAMRCPECGSMADEVHVVWGRRRRGWASAVCGLLSVALSVTWFATDWIRGIDWYAHCPTFVAVQLARFDNQAALKVLNRRVDNGEVDAGRVAALVPVALERQAALTPIAADAWTSLLASLDKVAVLTDAQQRAFYDQLIRIELEVRPQVRQGDPVAYRLNVRGGHPAVTGEWRITKQFVKIAGTQYADGASIGGQLSEWQRSGWPAHRSVTDLKPGRYSVVCVLRKEYFSSGVIIGAKPSFTSHPTVVAEIEVLLPEAPPTVRLVADQNLADQFRKAVDLTIREQFPATFSHEGTMELNIAVDCAIPIDAAFHATGRARDAEFDLGSFVFKCVGGGVRTSRAITTIPWIDGSDLTVTLHTDTEAALNTVDVFVIWNGQITLDPVTIKRDRR